MSEREILFRGKLKDKDEWIGEWIEGIYCPCYWDLYMRRVEKPRIIILSNKKKTDGLWREVIPETVGQYTGVKTYSKYDDELHKIFEDDLCYVTEFDCDGNDEQYLCQVVFDCGTFYFKDINSDWCRAFYEIEDIESDVEIVGNIHDNPEILKNPNP